MKLDLTKPLLVFLGAWNRAVLQPQWVARHLFGVPEGQHVEVGVFFDQANPGGQITFIQDVGLSSAPDRVSFFAASFDEAVLARVESAAIALFETLPHTPTGSYGVNFTYQLSDPSNGLLEQLTMNDALKQHYQIISESFGAAVSRNDGSVLNLTRRTAAAGVMFDFNYHYDVPPAAGDWRAKLQGVLARLHADSQKLLNDVYGVQMTEAGGFEVPRMGEVIQ